MGVLNEKRCKNKNKKSVKIPTKKNGLLSMNSSLIIHIIHGKSSHEYMSVIL